MSSWRECKLEDILNFGNGKSRPKIEGEYPIYGGNGILGYANEFNYTDETIILGRVGAYCGSVYYENNPIWVSDNALSVKPKEGNHTKFLFYFLKNINLNSYAGGSSHPLITQSLLNSLDIEICTNYEEQKAIAEVLSSLDDKIDLLHRQNKTLEDLAQTLFRQWFIEEAKEEWEEKPLGDVIETTSGGTPSRSKMEYYDNGTIHWVKSKELSGNYILTTEEKITETALKYSSAKLLPENSILIAMYGATVGEYAIIETEMTCNQAICALKPNNDYPHTFLFMYIKNYKDEIINMAVGSAQQNISQQLIKTLLVPNCIDVISEFHKKVEPSFEKIKSNIKQIQTLENMRDTLLPKLFSGEVKVEI